MSSLQDVLNALHAKAGFELIEHSVKTDQLRLIGRIPQDETRQNINNWLLVIDSFLNAVEEGAKWSVDISKQYFRKGPQGQRKVVYAHRVIIQCKDVAEVYGEIVAVITGSKQAVTSEVTSFPLPGANGSRNEIVGNKRGARGLASGGR